MKQIFIGEVKTKSPFNPNYQGLAWMEKWDCANRHADWISIHTNSLWGGSFKFLKWACRSTTKPVLAKGIHATDDEVRQALDCGADYVLVVDRLPADDLIDKCLIEVSEPQLLEGIFGPYKSTNVADKIDKVQKIVCNRRNVNTGDIKFPSSYDLECQLYKSLFGWMCQASCIKSREDVRKQADAFIVGEHLHEFCGLL